MKKAMKKAYTLIEALPYIQKFYGKVVVLKYGGQIFAWFCLGKAISEGALSRPNPASPLAVWNSR